MFVNFFHLSPEEKAEYIRKCEEEERERAFALQRKREAYEKEQEAARLRNMRLFHNPRLFLETEGLYRYDPEGSISSQELYQIYRDWCIREKIPLSTPRSFWLTIADLAPYHAMTHCTLTNSQGKRCRGFRGICPITEKTDNTDENALTTTP